MRKFGRTATIATTALLAATLAPASAGNGGHGGHGGHDGHGGYDGHGHGWYGGHSGVRTVVDGLDGPRGVDALGHGRTLVTEADGSVSLVVERRHRTARVVELTSVTGGLAPAVAAGKHGRVYILVGAGGEPGGPPAPGSSTLYEWRPSYDAPKAVFDVAAYQADDPDPYDLEDNPTESNPFGLAALKDGSVLIADAAGNDLIRWYPHRDPVTVATFMPRVVDVPEELGMPEEQMPSEAVSTSVTVGPDGYWYVGELRGFPATPGTSQIWRIKPGSVDAVCDPEKPWRKQCKRYADRLTSIMDLAADRRSVYAVSLSKMGWLAAESEEPIPGAEIGALYRLTKHRHHMHKQELAKGKLVLPGGVDVKGHIYVVGPVFGPGALMKIH